MVASRRHGDDALVNKGLNLLGQRLELLVAVAKLAKGSIAPAPDGAVGGEGEAVDTSSRHSDDALPSKGLDLLRQQLVLLLAVAQLTCGSKAPVPSLMQSDGSILVALDLNAEHVL